MGISTSRPDKSLTGLPDGERYFGLENFGNTCYCNSVLQTLYFCQPFREGVLDYYLNALEKESEETILTVLGELFQLVRSQKKKSGVLSPKRFVQRLKKDNDQFTGYMHQDAQEFLNFLLPKIADLLEKYERSRRQISSEQPVFTWLQEIFEGKLVHETRCLQCETVTTQEESFFDLKLPIEHNCSLTSCLKKYSSTSVLSKGEKYLCDVCQCKQEAHRRTKIKRAPKILICHLMRFDERLRKLMHRVVFPMEMKLCNTTDDGPDSDTVYNLFSVVVHSGSSMNHGHYVSLIKSHGRWLLYDDDHVVPIPDSKVQMTFGSPMPYSRNTEHGYILFYERGDSRPIRPLPPPRDSRRQSAENGVEGNGGNKFLRATPRSSGASDRTPRTSSEPLDGVEPAALRTPRAADVSRGVGETVPHADGWKKSSSKLSTLVSLSFLRGGSKSANIDALSVAEPRPPKRGSGSSSVRQLNGKLAATAGLPDNTLQ